MKEINMRQEALIAEGREKRQQGLSDVELAELEAKREEITRLEKITDSANARAQRRIIITCRLCKFLICSLTFCRTRWDCTSARSKRGPYRGTPGKYCETGQFSSEEYNGDGSLDYGGHETIARVSKL